MSTDRELLELAAKAAGYDTSHPMNIERLALTPPVDALWIRDSHGLVHTGWNPFTDDSAALKLAVKLGLNIKAYPIYDPVKHTTIVAKELPLDDLDCPRAPSPFRICPDCVTESCQKPTKPEVIELHGADPYAATRRAIVRVAAAIGSAS